jgi:hypothetical protein
MGHILFWYRKVLLFWAFNPAEASKVLGETLVSRIRSTTNEQGRLRVQRERTPQGRIAPLFVQPTCFTDDALSSFEDILRPCSPERPPDSGFRQFGVWQGS